MSDQINPTNEEQEETSAPETTTETVAETATETEEVTAPRVAAPTASNQFEADDDDYDNDDIDSDDNDEDLDDEDDDNVVEGPAEYVQREKSGRGRRIGGDVRPEDIDYKNIPLLSRFLDRRGRILSRRKTRVSAKVQRRIVQAIKRARHLALLPYTADQTRIVRSKRR